MDTTTDLRINPSAPQLPGAPHPFAQTECGRAYRQTLIIYKNIQGEFGHFRENSQTILSKVAKFALNIFYKL